jgi:hypothetical protein
VEDIEPPPEIGPHEGRELELMLAGKKPLAYFSELTRAVHFEWPDVKFDPYVRSGEIVKRDYLMIETIAGRQEEVRWVFFALPDQEWRIDAAYRHLREEARTKKETESDAYVLGRLLGYTDHEISVYVNWASFIVRD